MSGWHSLSGSLQYKSGTNAFGRLITKRRTWCVLEESECKLLLYKTEDDMHKQRQPQGHVDLSGAAITLDLEHHNQFMIISKKKEHVFTADNHESMMIWLIGLQSRREMHHKNLSGTQTFSSQMVEEHEELNHRPHLYMTNTEHPLSSRSASQRTMSEQSMLRRGKYGLQRATESVDSGIAAYKKPSVDKNSNLRSRSLPPVIEGLEVSRSLPLSPFVRQDLWKCGQRMSASHTHLAVDNDSDDVFAREIEFQRHQSQTLSRNWRKLQYAVLGHVPQCLHPTCDTATLERRSVSSRSASSDSAIEKGEGTVQELSARLGELERELISTKCELAKVMNRQTCYQELLLQKDDTIKQLGGESTDTHHADNKKTSKQNKNEKEFQERIRVLQNQNRFLNEEVKKLAKLRFQEHGEYEQQNIRLQKLEADIEKWKMDYVSVIQSSIYSHGEEGFDDVDLCLYGGDKHKTRIRTLLEEARKINPSLPTYDSLMNQEVHVDVYGFKHVYANTGPVLHYLCSELTHHFLHQAGVYEEHQRKWTSFMRQHGKAPLKCRSELKSLCRGGIPDRFRKPMWQQLVRHKVRDLIHTKGDYYYRNLCNMLPESPLAACYRKQISLDLMRTMPNNIKFSASGCKGVMDLQDVLLAFCIHNPTIGYCQGMNFIVGMSLIFLDPEDAFWMLVAVAESYFSPHYFDHSLIGAQADQQVLKDIVRDKLPALYQHLESIDIELCTITLNWFLAIFFDAVPFQTLLRIWDCFLLEGPKVLFRISLSILKLHERDILQKSDTMGIMKHLKACAKLTYDVEGLVKLSFEGLKPFPKRKDIISKQTCYLNALKEKYKKKELQRLAFAEREQLYMNMEAESGVFLGIECAVAAEEGQVWLCYGDQHIGKLSFVSCETGTMFNIDFKLDSRLMCMCFMGPNELLLGTISWMLVSVDIHKHEQVWQIQLHDAILSVCCYDDEETSATRIFSGLADGTVAVTEKPYTKCEPNVDVMYIAIGQAPVTCLMLLDEQLWCASGNTVAVIHAKTLDTMDTFSVSVNPYDHILSLQPSNYGIWISLRGSSILELWDPRTLNCRMLYDTRTDRYPQLRKEDDTYFNRARITSTLANGNTVWIGTGEGNLIIYEILESAQLKTPTEMSPSVETTSSMSYVVRPEKVKGKGNDESQGERAENKIYGNKNGGHPQWDVNRKLSVRRKSSSETDLGILQKNHYQDDVTEILQLSTCGTMGRICSHSDLEELEKKRNLSHCNDECFVNHAVEDEVELKLEAEARRESLTKLLDAKMKEQLKSTNINARRKSESSGRSHRQSGSSRRSSLDNKGKFIPRRLLPSDTGRSDQDDSGCESNKGLHRRSRTSCSSSRRSSLSRRGSGGSAKCKLFPEVDVNVLSEEEDVFEAHLEEKARRESLVLNEIDLNCSSLVNMKNVSQLTGNVSQTSHHIDGGNNCVVNICIDPAVDVTETNLEQLARRESLLGIELYNLDDSYVSSSPTSTMSHDFPHEDVDFRRSVEESSAHECKTTALGMSLDSTDGTDVADGTNDRYNTYKSQVRRQRCMYGTDVTNAEAGSGEKIDTSDSIQGDTDVATNGTFETNLRRKSSVISILDDVSALCSDCNSQKRKCKDCKKLLESQESLRISDRRMSYTESPDQDTAFLPDSKGVVRQLTKLNGIKVLSCDDNDYACDVGVNTKPVEAAVCDSDQEVHYNSEHELKSITARKQEILDKVYDVTHEHVNVFSNEKMDKSDLSRQDKVGIWLNSISHTFSLQDQSLDSDDQDKTGELDLLQSECHKKEMINNTDSGIVVSCCEGSKRQEGKLAEKRSRIGCHSNKCSVDDEDVFYRTEESENKKTEKSPDRPATLNLFNCVSGGLRRLSGGRIGSAGSDGSSGKTQKSEVEAVLNKKDSGTQYRLDFSSVHVETDIESEHTSPNHSVPSGQTLHRRARYGSVDSRKDSLDLGSIQEKCCRLESECSANRPQADSAPGFNDNKPERQQMFEFLKTPSLATRHASLGLKIIDDDLEWTELYSAQCTTPSPTSTTDKRFADFLRTPSMSSKACSRWSSYENISTPSHIDDGKFLHPMSHSQRRLSHSPSTASIGSELLYNVDLNLEAKMKISDKPVKCLLSTRFKNEPIILSFSGSYGDDEAVLKWRKHENEQLWTNEPVLEICSKTNMAILPTYMRRRMSSQSSFNSH